MGRYRQTEEEDIMSHEVTLITGDGVGPELAEAARRCVDATGVKIQWDVQEAGLDVMARTGNPLPEATMDSVRRTRCALKSPIDRVLPGNRQGSGMAWRYCKGEW